MNINASCTIQIYNDQNKAWPKLIAFERGSKTGILPEDN